MFEEEEYSGLDEYHDFILDETFEQYEHFAQETALDVWHNCVVLSVLSLAPVVLRLIILNFIFGCLTSCGYFKINLLHIVNGCIGVLLILSLTSGRLFVLGFWIFSYIVYDLSCYFKKKVRRSNCTKFVFIIVLVLCEYLYENHVTWLEIRGVLMVLIMKVISLSDDVEKAILKPTLIEFFGYTLCGANVLFGPWISFKEYISFCTKPTKKNIIWISAILKVLATSVLFLVLSNCWSTYFIPDNYNRWFVAYRQAFAFRTSHYFISYLAEAGMISAGFANTNKKDIYNQVRYIITDPSEIEWPSSLSVVVRKWNLPMHEFLKRYVYQSWLGYGKLVAILATFLISSLLHGLEVKVSVVLVSIGLFSYLQVAPRNKVAELFDCCVKVRPCKDCKHKHKRTSIKVRILLFFYSLMTVVHLAYLGILMDPSTAQFSIFEKWQNLYFISHIVMFFNVMILM